MSTSDDPELEIIRNTLELGEQARLFLNSNIGKYLLARAAEQVEQNVRELKGLDPTNEKEIRTCQNNIRVAENSIQWLVEAIDSAEEILRQEESIDNLEE